MASGDPLARSRCREEIGPTGTRLSRQAPAASIPVDEEELARFRRRLAERGFAESTGKVWASLVRTAYARGVASPDEVDEVFLAWSNDSRCGMRRALRELDAFRTGARP